MAGIRDSFVDLERHRLQLEQNVSKLRASLRHWQQWELEYEGMKEDVLALADGDTPVDSESLREDPSQGFLNKSNDILLTPKERKSLLVDDKGISRDKQQVLGLLSRRIDYVQRNITSVSSMLQAAEEKYAASQVLSQPEVRNEEGLPFTEILEQLDEEDNVISSTISKPGETGPQLMEALRKAGINELPKDSDKLEEPDSQSDKSHKEQTVLIDAKNSMESPAGKDQKIVEPHRTNVSPLKSSTNDSQKRSKGPQKNVSFADDTKVNSNHNTIAPKSRSPARNTMSNQSLRNNPPRVSKVLGKEVGQMSPMATVERKAETVTEAPFTPVIPTDESPEDAVLRRQMIQYNMEEIGAVVAELDLDEEGMSYSDDEDEDEDEDYPNENSSVEEDEDQFGRTRRPVLTDDYMAEMRALEKRLKNVGPNAEVGNLAAVNGQKEEHPSSDTNQPNATHEVPIRDPKKGVRFAPSLDVQSSPPPPTINPSPQSPPTTLPTPPPTPSPTPILSSIVIERPYTPSTDDPTTTTNPPIEPDEYDPALLQQEVATSYHKMRNRMIARQGGFMAQSEEEKAQVPLSEAEGGRKKVSRFKAARLGKA
ncbi:hypothetical protein JMJ35_001020 [Cladonia borealis]|uniref:DUF3835 domain-containing protein n=1 Tax=Cladonia borealis TaxID=184061 RepID=A0AA39V531_9LECA|nr:hypothetical protein JMJ35_001020 [Cladonia borealis]